MPLLAERGFSILDCVLLRVKVSTTEIGASPMRGGSLSLLITGVKVLWKFLSALEVALFILF